jgi:hypothetical protein
VENTGKDWSMIGCCVNRSELGASVVRLFKCHGLRNSVIQVVLCMRRRFELFENNP